MDEIDQSKASPNEQWASRPASVIILQILILINLAPIAAGFLFAFVYSVATNPASLLSIRSVLYYSVGFVLIFVFVGLGFGGLCQRKKYGYWLGLVFLILAVISGCYKLILVRSVPRSFPVLDLVVITGMLLLVTGVLLKLLFGRKEKLFFFS